MDKVLSQVSAGALGLATVEMLLHALIASLLPFVILVEESVHGLGIVLLAEGRERVLLVEVVFGTGDTLEHLAAGEIGTATVSHTNAVEIIRLLIARDESRLNRGVLMRHLLLQPGHARRLIESLLLLNAILLLWVSGITLPRVQRGRRRS